MIQELKIEFNLQGEVVPQDFGSMRQEDYFRNIAFFDPYSIGNKSEINKYKKISSK